MKIETSTYTAKNVRILTLPLRACRNADAKPRRTPYIEAVFLATLILTLWITLPAIAAQHQQLAEIEQAAERFLQQTTGSGTAQAAPLDRRLKLADCDVPLAASMRAGSQIRQRTIVSVRCTGAQPWKVYVPVNLIDARDVVVLKTALPRGHELTAADLELQQRDVTRLAGGYATNVKDVVGQRLKQSVRAGAIASPAVLASKLLVRRGQTVTLRAENEVINIRVAGKALMDGALGQRIRVENLGSGRVVEGLVRSAQLVEVLVQ